MMDDTHFMKLAIEKAQEGIKARQAPFGCVIVHKEQFLVSAHNTVWKDCDPTAHAEVNAIRLASLKLKTIDLHDCVLYTTCEPCPMCLSATHWSKVTRVVYGAEICDAEKAGFSELRLPAKEMVSKGGSSLRVEQGPCRDACRKLFDEWCKANKSQTY